MYWDDDHTCLYHTNSDDQGDLEIKSCGREDMWCDTEGDSNQFERKPGLSEKVDYNVLALNIIWNVFEAINNKTKHIIEFSMGSYNLQP